MRGSWSSAAISRLCPPELRARLAEVVKDVAERLIADSAGIALLDGGAVRYVAGYGFDWAALPAIPIGESLIGAVVARGCVVDSVDIREDPRCTTLREARRMGIAAFIGCPLRSADHGVIGALALHRREPSSWSAEQASVADAVARTTSVFLRSQLAATHPDGRKCVVRPPQVIICESPSTKDVYQRAARLAGTALSVLVQGETGTGKDILAQSIHQLSGRPGPFYAVNCAAIPDELFEAEFFGHAKGAFTGAVGERDGAFEAADCGTLFLDEVGDLAPRSQAKLLRAVEAKRIRRVGELFERDVDVRIICATNRPLTPTTGSGFRSDLYFRLAELDLRIEPLRERTEDMLALAKLFCEEMGTQVQRPDARLSDAAIEVLRSHHWPGNIREVKRVLCGAIIETPPGEAVTAETVRDELRRMGTLAIRANPGSHSSDAAAAQVEQDPKLSALWRKHNGNISAIARELQTSRQNLQQKLARVGLRRTQGIAGPPAQ